MLLSRSLYFIGFLLFLFSFSCRQLSGPIDYKIQKQAISDQAMVVSAHPLATRIGLDIMKSGGNAVDAAMGVHFALAVVYPVAGNIGGGGFMIYYNKEDQSVAALDFREKAPAAADRDMYLDKAGDPIEGLSFNGHLAAGVPGSVAGLFEAHARHGQLKDFAPLIEPAIQLAEKGFAITGQEASRLNDFKERFIKYNTTRPVFVKDTPWQAGDQLIQKELAWTLRQIQQKGKAGFYEGEVAQKIVAEMQAGKGIISTDDLKAYQAVWRKPVQTNYKAYQLHCMPPPSSGGVALAQLLEMVEPYPLADWGFHAPEAIHLMTEAERRAYADRATHLGDSDFYPVPQDSLMQATYLKKRMSDVQTDRATSSDSVIAGNFVVPKESEQTTHYSIVDAQGNAVSITTTINSYYGSKTVVGGAGFFLNNEMDDFSIKAGVPNFYGLIGAEANAIAPGKRMLSSMTPTIVTKGDDLFLVLGTPGGSTIITSVFQTILNITEYGMGAAEAVAAKRFHHQWKPDVIQYEKNSLSPETIDILKEKGHALKERDGIGRVEAVLVLEDGRLEGGADPRGDDHAEGF